MRTTHCILPAAKLIRGHNMSYDSEVIAHLAPTLKKVFSAGDLALLVGALNNDVLGAELVKALGHEPNAHRRDPAQTLGVRSAPMPI